MKNKIKIFRKLVRCASIALLSFSMAGCGADFLDTTPTNNISGSSICNFGRTGCYRRI